LRHCRPIKWSSFPANPIDNSPLALEEECAAIERELRMTEGRDDFDLTGAIGQLATLRRAREVRSAPR
jgi:hypothetical protein